MKIGDKVRIIKEENLQVAMKLGDEGVIVRDDGSTVPYVINVKGLTQWVSKSHIELISETSPSYYSFFRFLHPNMKETTCKELFDKIIKEYESSDRVK